MPMHYTQRLTLPLGPIFASLYVGLQWNSSQTFVPVAKTFVLMVVFTFTIERGPDKEFFPV